MPDTAIDAVRDGYEAFNRRDLEAVLRLLDPEIEFRMPMDMTRSAPVFHGPDGIREFFELLWSSFDAFLAEVERIARIGETIVVTGTFHARTAPGAPEHAVAFSHFWSVCESSATRVAFHDAANPFALAGTDLHHLSSDVAH